MLVDAGDREHGQTVVDYLKGRQVSVIDFVVATHPHADHIGGMSDVLSSLKVARARDSGYNHGSATQRSYLQTLVRNKFKFETPEARYTERVWDFGSGCWRL